MSALHLPNDINGSEIAIIGMSGRFPGAKTIDVFWQNLREGVESVSFFSDEELLSSGVDSTLLTNPNYIKANPVLSDVEQFDASFFGFSPKEAEITDPQHRLFLECAWEAIESAGYNPETYEGSIGVYAGAEINTYLINNIYPNYGFSDLQMLLGNDKDYLCSRVSYKLNLRGPSVSVQTACSTSLVAVHMACQSLLNGECDISLAGGVTVRVPQNVGYLYQEEGIASPDGHCRTFDAKARGSIFGSGVGIVVLKRLADAIADGDCIHTIIKGSAINNDGALKAGYTAPSPDGQSAVISEAQAIAGIEPETITYIEAHGSGTPLGDPIEIAALTQVFQNRSDRKGFCAIGSVKTNFGHLGTVAGVAGLIKTVLALKHQLIPPSLHFEQPNPKIDFANSPFYVNAKLSPWQTRQTPRRAGVSSLGIGGTNAHVILEEAPPAKTSETSRSWQLLMLSAKTSSALETATANLAEHLKQHPDLNLADVAYTLQVGRRAFEYRRTVVCQDIEDAVSVLQDSKRVLTSIDAIKRPVAFMFTGLGTQYVNMAWELYQVEPIFQETVDRCCELLKPLLGLDLRDVLYPNKNQTDESFQQPNSTKSSSQSGFDLRKMLGRGEAQADEVTQKLNQTELTQPAIFVIEYALAQLWQSWGIHPVAMIGYSIGEYVAATLAEVLSLEDAIALVAKRAQMIQELPGGAMLAVPLSEEKVRPLLNENLSLSAINGSSISVIAGTRDAVDELASLLTQKGLTCRHLQTSHAFHSHMMEPLASSLTELVKTINLQAPKIPYLSNVTGTWITAEQATDPSYWTKHLCQPVLFADGIDQLWKQHKPILLEVGPGQTLSSLALQCLDSVPVADKVVLPSLRDSYNQQSDRAFLLNTLGQLWLSGVQIDWLGFYANERRHRLPLPTYPFERQRYWIDAPKLGQMPTQQVSSQRKPDPADWFYIPVWKQSMPPVPFEVGSLAQRKSCWLVFLDECEVSFQIVQRLENENQDVIKVRAGEQFSQFSDREYTINPQQGDDYNALLQALVECDRIPNTIVHAWSVKSNNPAESGVELFEEIQQSGFYSLLFLTQAISKQLITAPLKIWVLSNNMHALESTDVCYPEKATLLGLCKVIPQEHSNITCQSIDLAMPKSGDWSQKKLIDQLMAEITGESSDLVIAYRGHQRWLQAFEAVRLENVASRPKRLRQGGVYLITGGLGGIGLTLAKYLAQTVQAKLVLLGRSGLPAKEEWEQWLATHDAGDRISTRIKKVQDLEELGASVLVISADVANEAQMQAALLQTEERFGRIHGVIHAAAFLGEELLRTIPETGYTECKLQFQPKVYGLYTLEKILQGRELDYCLLISSIGSVLGGVAVAAYTAANIFVDAFAHKQNQLGNNYWCSANWFHAENANLLRSSRLGATQEQSEIEVFQRETVDAFQRIFSHRSVPQIAIWRSDITAEIDKWIKRKPRQVSEEVRSPEKTSLIPRSNLRTPYVAPSSEIEYRIASLYQEFLGIEQVGIHDNFFDLGGHSLLATQLISHIRKDFQLEVPLRSFLEAPSIAEVALLIEEMLIGELEELTEEEACELISVNPTSVQ